MSDDSAKYEGPRWFREALDVTPEDRTVEVAGCPIHYLLWGNPTKPGVVLVHGGAAREVHPR